MKRILIVLYCCLFAAGSGIGAPAADPAKNLRAELARIFSDARLADAQLGVAVYSLDRAETIYEKNSRKLFVPASNNKILTAASALIRLGPGYRFKTRIWANGTTGGGVLKGGLIVEGFGDPSSSSRIGPKDPFLAFRDWAAQLKQRGITAIEGNILGDDGAFEETEHGQGWAWDDLAEGFAAPVTALQFNENMMELEIAPGAKPGSPAVIRTSPLPDYADLDSHLVTDAEAASPRIRIDRTAGSKEAFLLTGILPPRMPTLHRTVSVQQPVLYYLSALKYILSQEGVNVADCGIARIRGARPPASSLLWEHASAPLSELLAPLMKMSLNLGAETLTRVLGLELRGEGSFAMGKEVVEETLSKMGIPAGSYAYADGSGLSRMNLVSPEMLVQILRFMHGQQFFPVFYDSLPVAGRDGTLAHRMAKTAARNNVHAKTGSFANVSALSGYVQTADKETLAFSILVNNFLASRDVVENVQEKALARLAGFSRKTRRKPAGSRNAKPGTGDSGF